MARAVFGQQPARHCGADDRIDAARHRPRKSKAPVCGCGMSMIMQVEAPCPFATDGEIAAINLESARRRAWGRFARDPHLPGIAEAVVDNERLAAQFLGDLDALEGLETLAVQFARVDNS